MYEAIWQAVKDELSGETAKAFAARIWEHARWNSFDRMRDTAAEAAAIMREIGLADVEVLEYPADGVTAYGGWVMPQAWDVEDATLDIVEPEVPEPRLARYRNCPQNLMMYSAPTSPDGLVAEVVAVEDAGKASSYQGVDVQGKIVFADALGLDFGLSAFEAGAAGLLSDAMPLAGSPHDKGGGHLDRAVAWHNYSIPPWRTDRKGFGFSLCPADGRRLRKLLQSHGTVKVRACVRTRLYDGVLPAITGLLPGETDQEIAVTGHLFEPGANDNASGCALGLEAVRTLKALGEQGTLPGPRRGIRPVFTFEVRGYQAFLATWPHLRRLVAGLNLDMVGNDLSEARAVSNLVLNWPALPAYTDVLALELLRRLGRDDPLFRFRVEAMGLVDNLFGEPAVGAPTCVLGNWKDATYHTSLDRIETLSPAAMARFGRIAATYCAFLANAGLPEAVWLAHLVDRHGRREVLDAPNDGIGYAARKNAARLRSLRRLVGGRRVLPTRAGLAEADDWLCPWSHLFRDEELKERTGKLADRLQSLVGEEMNRRIFDQRYAERAAADTVHRRRRPEPQASEAERARAMGLLPRRAFKGSLSLESLGEAERRELAERTGLGVSWGAPEWLQLAMFLSNGKSTAWDIWQRVGRETAAPPLGRFCDTLDFLADHGFLHLRPVLTRDDYLAALRAVGLEPGAVAMVHSSLSQFGYVEGGADTVIDALVDALGSEGTLAMPGLSCSWVGRPPYDPAATPVRVGAVPDRFRRRKGVLRSAHPTHSVLALGPLAERIVGDHPPERPVFSPQSPFGQLYDLDAVVVMLCPLAANTILHMAEERAGLLLTDLVAHVLDAGRRREVTVAHAPWHANFDRHYEVLGERGMLRSAPLGESTIHLMRARDAVDVALENLADDPTLAMGDQCDCEFCRNLRAHLGAQGGC
ncbi:MAG: DUF4910 domain-containing protein [Planctomycetota bacterium]